MALDSESTVTQMHLDTILEALQKQLQKYIDNNPNQKMTKQIRMLYMASFSLKNWEIRIHDTVIATFFETLIININQVPVLCNFVLNANKVLKLNFEIHETIIYGSHLLHEMSRQWKQDLAFYSS